jgi:hypothetical protein
MRGTMKKKSIILGIILTAILLFLTGCSEEIQLQTSGTKADTTEVSYEYGKAKYTVAVPKKEDGSAKYEFVKEKPDGVKYLSTFYLATDTADFSIGSAGLVYNTSKTYKEKYGETKATFQGYLDFMEDPISTIPKENMEILEINGRKAVKRQIKSGSSGNYKYYGYNYMVEVDDIMPGSYVEITVPYKNPEGE